MTLLEAASKTDETVRLRHFTMTAGKFWSVALDKHLLPSIVPGRPTWSKQKGDAVKVVVTGQHPLVGINATAFLTGYVDAGGPDTVRGFLWRGADGVTQGQSRQCRAQR